MHTEEDFETIRRARAALKADSAPKCTRCSGSGWVFNENLLGLTECPDCKNPEGLVSPDVPQFV